MTEPTEEKDDLPECGFCGEPIAGEPVYDEAQVWYLGISRSTPFCDVDHLNGAAEEQSHAHTHDFYAA